MAILMEIPIEVRLKIIETVLFTPRDAPDPVTLCDEGRAPAPAPKFAHYCGCRSETSSQAYLPNGQGLLLTCKQLREETLSQLRKVELSLDIVMVNEELLYPTWTCIPVNCRHVDTLKVQVRIFGAWSGDGQSKLHHTPGETPPMTGSFHLLLRYFLLGGPSGIACSDNPNPDLHYTVGVLIIDVLTPTYIPPGFELDLPSGDDIQRRCWAGPSAGANQILSAERMCAFLSTFTYSLLYHNTCIPVARIINERVGKICFRVDGKQADSNGVEWPDVELDFILVDEYSSDDIPGPRGGGSYFPERYQLVGKRYFAPHCIQAMQQRRQAGLPYVDLETL